ncbi:hypothetical protein HDU93_006010 [Gonapodya sp. JEL0774]|nr:hypothetical protein HDU93_006010 [Gonapodya sp. JEL0774]
MEPLTDRLPLLAMKDDPMYGQPRPVVSELIHRPSISRFMQRSRNAGALLDTAFDWIERNGIEVHPRGQDGLAGHCSGDGSEVEVQEEARHKKERERSDTARSNTARSNSGDEEDDDVAAEEDLDLNGRCGS